MTFRKRVSIIQVALLIGLFWNAPLLRASEADAELVEKIDGVLSKAYPADQPGAAVIATRSGEVIFRKAYGMADLELSVPLEPEMVFRLGSITKQFTAAAILLLEEQGLLSVKDSILKYLPNYPLHGHEITIEHLLTHTSGIYNYTAIPGHMQDGVRKDVSTEELIEVFKDQPMNFAPGERWSYSNSGYVLLGAIIEKVSGQTYEQFVQRNIFDKLEMHDSHYGGHQLIPRRVAGYQWDSEAFTNASYLSMTQPHAAGSLLSSVDDLNRWNAALVGGRLLSEESYQKMTTPFVLNSGEATTYGYGLAQQKLKGEGTVAHGGGIFGFSTYALWVPSQEIYIVVLSNAAGKPPAPGMVAAKVGALMIGDPYTTWTEIDLPPEVLSRYVGVYKIDEDQERTVTVEDGKIYTKGSGGAATRVFPASETTFFYENSLSYFEIILDDSGTPTHMLMYQSEGEPEKATLISSEVKDERQEVKIDPSIYDSYAGVYELAPGFNLTVTRDAGRLLTQATGQQQVEIFPESRTKFFLKVVDAQLVFVWQADGTVNEVILYQAGREIHGKRVK